MSQPLWFTKMLEQLSPAQALEWHERKNVLHKEAGYGQFHAEALALVLVQQRASPDDTQPDWIIEILDRLSPDQREEYEERAAIMQYDGGLFRSHAENLALLDIIRRSGKYTILFERNKP